MEARPLDYLVATSGGRLEQGDGGMFFHRTVTDSRRVGPEDLFIALQGERFDGHDYVVQAAAAGATAVMVDRPVDADCAKVIVDDTRAALGRFAARYRRDYELPIIGIAGSNGKTSTKELLGAILRRHMATVWSEASFNNDIGVPVTLLRIENFHRAAVLELGTNHPGELAPLVKMAAPTLGVITSIGREHLEFFGDMAGVAREEGMLAELLPTGGKLFLYGDSEWSKDIAARSTVPVSTVGTAGGNDWRAGNIRQFSDGVVFRVDGPVDGEFRLRMLGHHQATNALLAIAVAAELGVPCDVIAEGLASCMGPRHRLQVTELNGVRIIDDAYNANADSVNAALNALADMPCEGKRLAVLGPMAELGENTRAAHEEAGQVAAALGIDVLLAVGANAALTVDAARDAGLASTLALPDNAAAVRMLRDEMGPGDVVLLKGSRTARLEEVIVGLKEPA